MSKHRQGHSAQVDADDVESPSRGCRDGAKHAFRCTAQVQIPQLTGSATLPKVMQRNRPICRALWLSAVYSKVARRLPARRIEAHYRPPARCS